MQVGFSRKTINPKLGNGLRGYFILRLAEGIHDDIEAQIIAITVKEKTVVLVSLDLCEFGIEFAAEMRKRIGEALGIPGEAVIIFCTHTHQSPYVGLATEGAPQDVTDEYTAWLYNELVEGAKEAFADRCEARMSYGLTKAEGIAFSRRFLMKDGSIATNPGVSNPDIVKTIGEPDLDLSVVRFDRDNADTVVLANFGCHPDTVGGNLVSADWPGVFRRTFEKAIDGTKAVFVNGAEGEINHINVFPKGGDMNGLTNDFDNVPRGFEHARHMGRVVAGAVMGVYDKLVSVECESVGYAIKAVGIPTNRATAKELPEAHRIMDLHVAGRDCDLPYKGMLLTTVVAEAQRMVDLEFGPDAISTLISVVSVGPIAFVGISGEPFSAIGRGLKEAKGWDMVIPCAITNGWVGYFPNKEAYEEGGYEARSSNFKAGVAELLISEGTKVLDEVLSQTK